MALFALGEQDEALMCVEPNVDFGYEAEVSGAILAQMKAGKLNPETLSGELRALLEDLTRKETEENEKKAAKKTDELNATFSGKYLGDTFTAEQSVTIRTGTFEGMALGDYWTIDGVNWRIADFDYLIRSDKANISKHHVIIVPDKSLYRQHMNSINTTSGGYAASEMRRYGLDLAKDMIKRAFGSGHILADFGVELMTKEMVFGDGDKALSLFQLETDFRKADEAIWFYWLQDVVSAAYFAIVNHYGNAYCSNASNLGGVRPAFALY